MTGMFYLVPSECVKLDDESGIPNQLTEAVELFSDDLPHAVMFPIEYDSWVREWKECSTSVPDTLADSLEKCSTISYPNMIVLLKIALTLPITSCESERSFSQLHDRIGFMNDTYTDFWLQTYTVFWLQLS